jgi:hypothetical protein
VHVSRCRRSGAFLLNPQGTFRGYGAYVGVNPYREVTTDASDVALGEAIVELLALSGPTGVPLAEARDFLEAGRDTETRRIRRTYGLDARGLSTSRLARRFLQADVEQRHGQKSWIIQPYRYDARRRLMSGADETPTRVRHAAGAAALGAAVRDALRLTAAG